MKKIWDVDEEMKIHGNGGSLTIKKKALLCNYWLCGLMRMQLQTFYV